MSAVVVDLPLVPVMTTTLPGARMPRPLAKEELDVADHLDARVARARDAPMGLGMGQGNAGREHERGEARPVGRCQIAHRKALGDGFLARARLVVPEDGIGAARLQARARRQAPLSAKAEDRNVPAGEDRHGNHNEGT